MRAPGLAAVASLSALQVRKLIHERVIRARDRLVQAEDARAWLARRGIPGFSTAS